MIYISSSCVQENQIFKSIERLVSLGFRNIELSGGTNYYPSLENDLLKLKNEFNLNYLLHNYFPPPKDHFVANIASLDQEIYQRTIDHYLQAIDLSKILETGKFGIHAGYLIDFQPSETGNVIKNRTLANRQEALNKMAEGLSTLQEAAGNEVTLYLENNVLSSKNYLEYGNKSPFLVCNLDDFYEFSSLTKFNLLFDLAHFKVSQKSQEKFFEEDYFALMSASNYIHLSGNDGFTDQNKSILQDVDLLDVLTRENLTNKTVTLEVYDGNDAIMESYEFLENLLDE
jgi:sugar phosphate isomerase/epimerase